MNQRDSICMKKFVFGGASHFDWAQKLGRIPSADYTLSAISMRLKNTAYLGSSYGLTGDDQRNAGQSL
jgi:hypothetical protein